MSICLRSISRSGHTCRSFRRTLFSFPTLPSAEPSTSTFHTRKILPYTQRQLYNLVADIDSYHHFLPFCTASRVLTPHQPSPGNSCQIEAELSVGFMGVNESYTSIVTLRPYELVQVVASSSTPLFKSLETIWRFQPASPTSPHPSSSPPRAAAQPPAPALLSIDLKYEFANPLHGAIATGSFGRVSDMMIGAFEKRCLEVYGKGEA